MSNKKVELAAPVTPVSHGPEWINAEDGLPKANTAIYFILRETGERHIGKMFDFGKMFDLSARFWSHESQKFYSPQEVSHWVERHIPAPPEIAPVTQGELLRKVTKESPNRTSEPDSDYEY